jgi:gamma-glutamyltranspeptidase/glutathione hydrolase
MGVLERGGNAFDAAVATGFALQVVEPHLNGPGGEVPILGHLAGADRPFALCGQGIAPAAATPQHFADIGLDMIPGTGHLPAVVPGSFDAWMLLLRDHGTISLRAALEPAIDLAAGGFPLVDRAAGSIHAIAEHFRTHWPSSAAVWLPHDRVPQPGHTFRWPALAATWKRLLSDAEAAGQDRDAQIEAARRVWSQGFVAELIDDFMRQPLATVDGRRDAGLLTGDDMATWQAQYEATVSTSYARVEVHKTDTWGQGPALLMLLRLLDRPFADGSPRPRLGAPDRRRTETRAGRPRRLVRRPAA